MIHGMWSRPTVFAALRAELEAAGMASTAATLPWHDQPAGSPAPEALSTLGLADYVAALERDVALLPEAPVLMGHSMGGLLAQLLAARVRARGLILLATAPSAQAASAALGLDSLRTMAGVTRRWGWWRQPTLLDADHARRGVMNGVPAGEAAPAVADLTWDSGRVLRQVAAPWLDRSHASRVDFSRISGPALVITGTNDRTVPPAVSRKTARLLAAAGVQVDFEAWPDIGHWLFHTAARPRLAAAIARFMSSLG